MMSPSLRQFLTTHPGAAESFSNVLTEAFAKKNVQLYYFYSTDTNVTPAYHYYPDDSSVGIVIEENLSSCEQCIGLIFEMLNSEREQKFQSLMAQAQNGALSKTNFATAVMRQEFGTVEKMKTLLPHFKLSKAEMKDSYYYDNFMGCPDNFDGYLAYSTGLWSKGNDRMTYYEQEYDYLRGTQQIPNTTTPSVH
ncbi:MAG TPA: hypothetical protein VGN23_14155 [Verrucomicrobiae bacterium]|jgi:hypothetical protein